MYEWHGARIWNQPAQDGFPSVVPNIFGGFLIDGRKQKEIMYFSWICLLNRFDVAGVVLKTV